MGKLTMSIAIPEALRDFVEARVGSGQFGNTSEYIRHLIRKDQEEQARAELRALIAEGLASGPPAPMTSADWDELGSLARDGEE